ncbi:MAG: ABC transporter permease subunit [Planctomycetales bacterium]|nr:ABC transporter permease subunit [Planctomycetales bacterium]MBN8625331.1 ABC transporter permease subunit [Planctomycetota bacterium]
MKENLIRVTNTLGLDLLEPMIRLAARDEPRQQLKRLWLYLGVPALAMLVFCGLWYGVSRNVQTKYGAIPTPREVAAAAGELWTAHQEARAKATEYLAKQQMLSARFGKQAQAVQTQVAAETDPARQAELRDQAAVFAQASGRALERRYSGAPTYLDQILTSLKTVFAGFTIASLIAVPIGILCGMSRTCMAAFNPLVQIFKPVSPLAWLPLVMILVGALYTTDPSHAWFEKSFISSAVTVALCSLWPTLVNTAIGVASIDKDYLNVARVLKLSWSTRLRKIVVPAAMPYIFTGLRISLGVGWMVLIAAEMLAQNPGLGKFVWDMFQNGSSRTLAMIMVAVFTIGGIGFALDRVMVALQRSVSYGAVTH